MQTPSILRLVVGAILLTLSIRAIAQQPPAAPDRPLDAATRNRVIDELLKQIDRIYVYPEVAKQMEAAIRARQAKKEYDGITSGQELARVLTDHLRRICKTDHLNVEYFPAGIPYDSEKPPVAADVERFREAGRRRNYQYKRVERLDGGVGLLQVDGFYPEEWAQDTIVASMAFLANSDAIILDLRNNHGGAAAMLLATYFFDEATHLTDQYTREKNTTRQYWTYPIVPGKKLADKDLYILTSQETVSAPEALAIDMQAVKRATIVGEATRGGALPTTIYRITDHFSAAIPFARTGGPGDKTDRVEGGVKPDVVVPADQALITAHLMALKKAVKRHSDDPELAASLQRTIAEKEKELEAIKSRKAPPATP